MTEEFVSDDARERLDALTQTNDGYALSEKDLEIRGPGELLGVKQSGLPEFKIADLVHDRSLLELARADAMKYSKGDELEKSEISARFNEGKFLFAN